ncbi:IS630 family transposase [Arthrobacter sp. I2-34]|uniref:IS630 family transposase n=1 Tax=Arthrobacter hankyongi TaxID=2904801 RepID=A0ABS9L8R4_9MICC|nr:IS630 family transposase [Arthrobacter hankyongi]MCG2623059.1 IS630 family transposase [Arthrobacter hankyongi]
MAERVKVRRLTPEEGRRLQRIVRRGGPGQGGNVVRWRRATMILASAGGNTVPVIARLLAADEDTVRQVIRRFNEIGLDCLDPEWAGGRPRLLTDGDEEFIAATAAIRPGALGLPFTRWSLRKLAGWLAACPHPVRIGREALRALLHRHGISFQRTATWKESPDPEYEAKLQVIEDVVENHPDRTFAFDEFGPLGIRPTAGSGWAPAGKPQRIPANYHRTAGVRYFHGCYSVGSDTLWGVNRCRKGTGNSLAALKSIRASVPDGQPVFVILDNLSAHKAPAIRHWAESHAVRLCFTPTYASWANPIEAHFGVLRQFTLANSVHPNHTVQTRKLHEYLNWRNTHARTPEILEAERRERTRVRSEKHHRWGRHEATAA